MFAATVENALKSRGRTAGTTGLNMMSLYSLIWMIRVAGGFGVRATIGAAQVLGNKAFEALRSIVGGRRQFFYLVPLSTIQ